MNVYRKLLEDVRNSYLQIIAIFLMVLVVLIVYWQDLSILLNEGLRGEAVGHIIIVPFLVSFLLYRKRKLVQASLELERLRGRRKLVSVSDFVGAALCLTAFLLYWYGSYTFYPLEYHVASLIIFIMGLTLILTNMKTLRILIFPIMFLAFLMPPPSTVIYSAGGLLATVNTQGSYALLRTAGLPVSLSYNYGAPIIALNMESKSIEFAAYQASSGLYSLIAFSMFATFLVYITSGSLGRRITLFVLGLLVLPIINIIRISIIVSVAYWLGEEIAMNIFHTITGWLLIFGGILLLLLTGEKILHLKIFGVSMQAWSCSQCRESLKKRESFCMSCGKLPKTTRMRISKVFWIKAVAVFFVSFLVTFSVQAPAFAFAPGLTVSDSNPQMNTNVFPNITDYRLHFLYRDVRYEKVAGQDVSLVYAYLPQNTSTLPVYVIVGVANSISNLHNWEVSLIAWQTAQGLPPLASLIDAGDLQLTENPRIIAHYLVFLHSSNYTYVALYWYQTALFKNGLTVEPRYVRINLLVLTTNPKDSSKLMVHLQGMGKKIAVFWEPLAVQSLVSIGIPVQQFLLGLAVVGAVFVQTSEYALEQRKKGSNLKIFEKFATQNEKLLYKTIIKLCQETKETTTRNIASALEKVTGQVVKPNELSGLLKNLEEHGLIKADITNSVNQPKLVWKP